MLAVDAERTGMPRTLPPSWVSQSGLPVSASRAKKLPSSVPPNTSPPAVESRLSGPARAAGTPIRVAGRRLERANRAPGIVAVERVRPRRREGDARLVYRLALVVDRAHLAHRLVEQPRLRAVTRAVPVRRRPGCSERRACPLLGAIPGLRAGPALRVQPVGPRLFRERHAGKELACRAIEHVVEAVAIGLRDQLPLAPPIAASNSTSISFASQSCVS